MFSFFFFNDTATTEIYTLSLHDALPICIGRRARDDAQDLTRCRLLLEGLGHLPVGLRERTVLLLEKNRALTQAHGQRSEEHTSELQSRLHLVCRLLLEKKKTQPCTHRQP